MKKIICILLVCLLAVTAVYAQGRPVRAASQISLTNNLSQNQTNILETRNISRNVSRIRNPSAPGQLIRIEKLKNKRMQFNIRNVTAHTNMELTQNKTQLRVKLSNGRKAEVKIMPDTASERAIERLKLKVCSTENNCTIELKQVGKNQTAKPAYEVNAEKPARFLGIFKTKMKVKAEIDAETGEVISSKKPWWAFLAAE